MTSAPADISTTSQETPRENRPDKPCATKSRAKPNGSSKLLSPRVICIQRYKPEDPSHQLPELGEGSAVPGAHGWVGRAKT